MPSSNSSIKYGGLRAKLFILIAVPLFFEAIVASSLMYVQHLYVKSVSDETKNKLIIYRTNRLWLQAASMMIDHSALNFAIKSQRDSHWQQDYETIVHQSDELRALLTDSEQTRRLDDLRAYLDKIHILSKPPEQAVALDSASAEELADILKALKATKRLTRASIEIGKAFREFKLPLIEQSRKVELQIEDNRRTIQAMLIAAALGSILVAGFTFRYFIRNVYGEMRALLDNIELFKQSKPLAPVSATGDEIVLLHGRFYETAKIVQQAQHQKREFVQTISRFLKEPLHRVLDFVAELAANKKGTVDKKTLEGAQRSEKSLQRLILLLDDLLALNEKNSAALEIRPAPVALKDIVGSSVEAMSAQGNPIEVRVAADLIVLADSSRIVQVIVNLLSNAIKFSQPRAPIRITAEKKDGFAEVRVADSGRGIPSSKLDSVFEAFTQVEVADGTTKGGSGLGLPICKHIVELHGGKIGVVSEAGQGATFWFQLPLAEDR